MKHRENAWSLNSFSLHIKHDAVNFPIRWFFFSLFLRKGVLYKLRICLVYKNVVSILIQPPKVWELLSIQARSYTLEDIFAARNCEATHGVLISKLFFSFTQQVLEWGLVQVWNRDHVPLHFLSNIDRKVAL